MEQRSSGISRRLVIMWLASIVGTALLAAFSTSIVGIRLWPGNVYEQSSKRQELLARMRLNLLASVEQEKSAVMALTDEESRNHADKAREAAAAVERDRRNLESLPGQDIPDRQAVLLHDFDTAWKTLREIDTEILDGAVQNTNLKAAELSRTIGSELLEKIEQDLGRLTAKVTPAPRRCEMELLAGRAVIATVKIARLQALHVDEEEVEQKKLIAASIEREADRARTLLKTLDGMTGRKSRAFIREARLNFDEYLRVSDEVIRLSELNTNHGSRKLSLGKKRIAAAECDRILKALLASVQQKAAGKVR
jgi:hypothetical protein